MTSPSRVDRLAVGQRDRQFPPARGRASRTHPLMFWPRSNTWPRATRRTATGASSWTARTGRRRRGDEVRVAVVGDDARRPRRESSNPGSLQPSARAPQVDRLAGDQIGRVDVRPRAAPPSPVPATARRAVGEVDVHLREERELAIPTGRGRAAARPGRGTSRRTGSRRARSGPGRSQPGDVVGLDLEPVAVLGEPGRQLGVADALAVDERLVDPVRGRVQPRAARPRLPASSNSPRTSIAGRRSRPAARSGLDRLDPPRRPVLRVEQPELEHIRAQTSRSRRASVHTFTCQATRSPERSGGPAYSTSTLSELSTRPLSQPLSVRIR